MTPTPTPMKAPAPARRYVKVPHPGEMLWPIGVLCLLFHRRPRTLYDVLWRHADHFEQPMYQRITRGPRRRVLNARDVNVLRELLGIEVRGPRDGMPPKSRSKIA